MCKFHVSTLALHRTRIRSLPSVPSLSSSEVCTRNLCTRYTVTVTGPISKLYPLKKVHCVRYHQLFFLACNINWLYIMIWLYIIIPGYWWDMRRTVYSFHAVTANPNHATSLPSSLGLKDFSKNRPVLCTKKSHGGSSFSQRFTFLG